MTWRTLKEWNEKGRVVRKDEKCLLKCPQGFCLFEKKQTKKAVEDWSEYWDEYYENIGMGEH